MAAKAELKAKLTVQTSQASAAFKKFRDEARAAGHAAGRALGTVGTAAIKGLAIGIVAGATAMADGTKKAFDLGESLNHLSDRTGIAVDSLAVLTEQFKDGGLEAEDLSGAMSKLQKNLVEAARTGAGPAAQAFDLIGESVSDLMRLDPAEYFTKVGKGIAKIKNPAVQTATAMALFGKTGSALLPVFKGGNFEEMAKIVGRQAQLLKANAQLFDDTNNRLSRGGIKLQGFFVGFASAVAPGINKALEKFDDLDLSSQGEKFGNFIKDAANAFATKTEGSVALLRDLWEMMKAAPAAVEKGVKGVQGAGNWLGQMWADFERKRDEFNARQDAKARGIDVSKGRQESVAPKNRGIASQGKFPQLDPSAASVQVSHPDEAKKLDFWTTGAKTANPNAGLDPNIYRFKNGSAIPWGKTHDSMMRNQDDPRMWKALKENKWGIRREPSNSGHAQHLADWVAGKGAQNDRMPHSTSLSRMGPGQSLEGASGLGSTGGLSQGAYAQTPTLNASERRGFENARIAQITAAGGTRDAIDKARDKGGRGYGVVRAGDRARAKNVAKEEARKALTIEGTNAILKETLNYQKGVWGATGGGSDN